MKRFLTAAVVTAGLLSGAAAIAQGPPVGPPPPGGGFDDGTTTTTTAPSYDAGYGYQATGWNPSLVLALSGGLAAGSVALKGLLRKR